jgi:hypothetical protein
MATAPKPFRVKRNKKPIGSFVINTPAGRVNLDTKDAEEAWRRSRLWAAGQWPPEEAAAKSVKEALGGTVPTPAESQQQHEPAAAPPAPSPEVPPPSPAPAAPVVHPQVNPVDAVNAAAAGEAELVSEAATVASNAGVDLTELVTPDALGGAHLWLQGQALRGVVYLWKGKAPKLVTIESGNPLRAAMGKLWQSVLTRWNLSTDALTPGSALLLLGGVTAFTQLTAMLAPEEQPIAPEGA